MDRDEWRRQVSETAIEPELPIIDAHHHLWPVPPLPGYEAYTDETIIAEIGGSGHNIVASVAVEAHGSFRTWGPDALRPVGETEHAEALAQRCGGLRDGGLCAAIVAHADLSLGAAVDEVLEAHRLASPKRLKGIRHITAADPDLQSGLAALPGLLGDRKFRAGFALLAPRGLVFDAWVMHPQLGELRDLARAFPQTRIVVDHLGGPIGVGRYAGREADAFADWRAALTPLAACENVYLKAGGLHLSATGFGRLGAASPLGSVEMARLHGPYFRAAIELFGPGRVMFESNAPVDRMSTPYDVLWNAFKLITQEFSAAERAAMFAGTARLVYGIGREQERPETWMEPANP